MHTKQISAGLGAVAWLLTATPVFAQHEGHQTPGTPTTEVGNAVTCAQNAKGITTAIEQTGARIEAARQSNDPANLRAAVSDFQTMLAQMKAQLADCVSLASAPAGSMGNMPGMDHSTMAMPPGAPVVPPGKTEPVPAAPAKGATPSTALQMTLTSTPSPPRTGDNTFEVVVKDTAGKPVADASVSLAFYMPPMPAMKMPAMRNAVTLSPAGNGIYRGAGSIVMAGAWDVTITVSRGGQTLGKKTIKLKAE